MTLTNSPVTLLNSYQKFGTEIPEGMTTAEALDLAGMTGWNQRLVEPEIVDGLQRYNPRNHRFVVADLPTGPRVLGAVTEAYRPIQIEEAFMPLMDGFKEQGLIPMIVGAYDDGGAAFVQFSVPDCLRSVGGDEIRTTLVLAKRNDGTGAVLGFPTAERIMCANQLGSIAKKHKPMIAVRHTRNADPYVTQTAERLLGIAQDWDAILGEEVERLASMPMTMPEFVDDFVPALLGPRPDDEGRSQTIYNNKFHAIIDAWNSPVAASGDTAWRAWNAVSEFEQHHRTQDTDRMARAVLHGRQPLSDRALALLTA